MDTAVQRRGGTLRHPAVRAPGGNPVRLFSFFIAKSCPHEDQGVTVPLEASLFLDFPEYRKWEVGNLPKGDIALVHLLSTNTDTRTVIDIAVLLIVTPGPICLSTGWVRGSICRKKVRQIETYHAPISRE